MRGDGFSVVFFHHAVFPPQMLVKDPTKRPSVEELFNEPWLCYDLDAADSATDPAEAVAEAAADPAQVFSSDPEAAPGPEGFLTGTGSSRRNPLLQKLSAVMEADPREEAPEGGATGPGTPEQGADEQVDPELSSTTASGGPPSSRPSADGLVLVGGASPAPPLAEEHLQHLL